MICEQWFPTPIWYGNFNNVKEKFESGEQNQSQSCNKNNILTIIAVILIIYILLSMSMSNTEKKFNLQEYI